MSNFKKIISHRYFPIIAGILAIVITLPTIRSGWSTDDYFHRLIFDNTNVEASQLRSRIWPDINSKQLLINMFKFVDGKPENVASLKDLGMIPWWSSDNLKLSFCRPISSLIYLIDYRLWPNSPEYLHLHSILWYGILVIVVAILYRRVFGSTTIAGLAALLFAVNEVHPVTVQWLANRYSIITGFFCVLTILLHIQWREKKRIRDRILVIVFFIISLFSSEAGIITFAYLMAYELFVLTNLSFRIRIKGLVPYFFLIIIWRICYNYLNFGTSGTNLYVDPVGEPLQFLGVMIKRLPFMINNLFAWLPADVYFFLSEKDIIVIGIILTLGIFIMGWLIFPLLKQNQVSRFLLVGAILSLIPFVTCIPQRRNLLLANIGAMGLVAQFVCYRFDTSILWPRNGIKSLATWALLFVFIGIHFIHAPLKSFLTSKQSLRFPKIPNSAISSITSNSELILLNPPTSFDNIYLYPIRFYQDLPNPSHIRILSVGTTPVQIKRTDERTLIVRPKGGYLRHVGSEGRRKIHSHDILNSINALEHSESSFWNNSTSMYLRKKIVLTGVNIQITAVTEDGRPAEATFRFDTSLETPSKIWIKWDWDKGKFKIFTLPKINQSITL